MSHDHLPSTPRAVVAVPVRDEAERIARCLGALAAQQGVEAGSVGAVLFLNNCTDATMQVVGSCLPGIGLPVRVVERSSARSTAGWARREAMDHAARWLEEGDGGAGAILTTDADSRVGPDWVARNLAALAAGADAVAGRIALDEDEAGRLPAALLARGRLEAAYDAALLEIESLVDPLAHDPWPRHGTTSGATLAVRLCAYRRVGGMPPLALGEDKAFVSSLLSSDARVRHDPSIVVTTSGRLQGRAPGGAADTMRLRSEVPDSPCDPRLEPLPRALLRYGWRRRLRRLHAERGLSAGALRARWLGIAPDDALAIAALPTLGAVLAALEAASPRLAARPLRPAELPTHIGLARSLLAPLRLRGRLRGRLPALAPTPFAERHAAGAERAGI